VGDLASLREVINRASGPIQIASTQMQQNVSKCNAFETFASVHKHDGAM
jgi:hypothetical protein